MKKNKLVSLFISLIFLLTAFFLFTPEVYALTWDDFAKSMNQAFSEKNALTLYNILFIIIILLVIYGIVMIIRYDAIRTDKIRRLAYQEVQRDLMAKRELLKGSNNRSWFRMPLQMEFKWHHWPLEDDDARPKIYTGLALDLSGGGMLFQTTEFLTLNDQIKLWLNIDETRIELTAEVVRIQEKTDEEGRPFYLIGVKFTDIREGIRDKIIAWLLKTQQELMLEQEELEEETNNEESANTEEETEAAEIIEEDAVMQEENESVEDEASQPDEIIEEKNIIEDLFTRANVNFSGVKNEDSIDLSVLLENEESIKFNITILDRIHNDSKSTIITLELRETEN